MLLKICWSSEIIFCFCELIYLAELNQMSKVLMYRVCIYVCIFLQISVQHYVKSKKLVIKVYNYKDSDKNNYYQYDVSILKICRL